MLNCFFLTTGDQLLWCWQSTKSVLTCLHNWHCIKLYLDIYIYFSNAYSCSLMIHQMYSWSIIVYLYSFHLIIDIVLDSIGNIASKWWKTTIVLYFVELFTSMHYPKCFRQCFGPRGLPKLTQSNCAFLSFACSYDFEESRRVRKWNQRVVTKLQ